MYTGKENEAPQAAAALPLTTPSSSPQSLKPVPATTDLAAMATTSSSMATSMPADSSSHVVQPQYQPPLPPLQPPSALSPALPQAVMAPPSMVDCPQPPLVVASTVECDTTTGDYMEDEEEEEAATAAEEQVEDWEQEVFDP